MFLASTVDPATKATWCNNQIASCTNICWDNGYDATTKFCQPDTLQYDCVCSNGVRPNATGNYFIILHVKRTNTCERTNEQKI